MNTETRRALGKGLSALLPQRYNPSTLSVVTAEGPLLPEAASSEPAEENGHPLFVPVDHIRPNSLQPRVAFDERTLAELAASIKENGIIQPLIVQPDPDGKYELVAGERRLRAAKLAGLTEVPVVVSDRNPDTLLLYALVENIQREDLNPIETAEAMQRLRSQLNLSHEQIAERTGKDRSSVTNLLRILKLPADVQTLIAEKKLSMGHAKALLAIEDDAQLISVANTAAAQGYSVRQLERMVSKRTQPESEAAETPEPQQDANIRAAVRNLEDTLGTRVRIVEQGPSRGRIEIEYYSQDDLQRIYALITRDI